MTVTVDDKSEAERWAMLKAKLQKQFLSISAAAAHFGCHVNSLRQTVSGLCPLVADKLREEGFLER